jgi:hypothetical protein
VRGGERQEEGGEADAEAVAYLTNTDGSRTSRVVEVDAQGRLALTVERRVWSDPAMGDGSDRLVFEGTVDLGDEVLTVF